MIPILLRASVCALLLLAVPARGQQVGAQQTGAQQAGVPPSILGEILQRGTLRVGLTGDYRPFSIKGADGAITGLDADEAAALAKGLGVSLEIVPTSWPTLMGDLLGHKFDVAMGGITVTLDRAKTAYFSTPVLLSGKTPIARCADKDRLATLAQIDQPGVKVIVNPGGTNERFARANIQKAELILFPNNATIFEEIVAGHADVMMTDAVETRLQQKLHPELCALHPDEPFDHSSLAFMMPQDGPLQQAVNAFLAIEQQSGARQALLQKWLP